MATEAYDRRQTGTVPDALCAALLGLVAGVALGIHAQPLYALLVHRAGG